MALLAGGVAVSSGLASMSPAFAQAAPPASPVAGQPPIDTGSKEALLRTLLDRAAYWRTLSPPQAVESLNRALAIDPTNADILAATADVDIDLGKTADAQGMIKTLTRTHPSDPRLSLLVQRLQAKPVDPAAIEEARQLAASGKNAQAVEAYQRIFGGPPPRDYAAEYYLAMNGVEGRQKEAQTGLAAYVTANPQDVQLQLSYAQLLTYGEDSRPDGIDRLQALSQQPSIATAARTAWRQALLWQGADFRAQAQLEAYLKDNPADAALLAKREDFKGSLPDQGALSRFKAYQELEAKNLADADKDFQAALQFNPQDADAMIMLAVIRKQQGRAAESKQFLDKAIAAAPDRKDDFLTAVGANAPAVATAENGGNRGGGNGNGDAGRAVRAEYAAVTALTNRGEYARAEAALRKLMGRRPPPGSLVQLGYIQLQAGSLAAAEATFRQAVAESPRSAAAVSGLASTLSREGKNDEAVALYGRVGNTAGAQAIGQIRAAQLRDQAHDAQNPAEQVGLYRSAIAADPSSPWLKLELARVLWSQGQTSEARRVMDDVGTGGKASNDQIQAGLIWAQERNDLQRAGQLVSRVPARNRTPLMEDLQQRAALDQEIRQATGGGSDRLVQVAAAAPDPTGARGAAVAAALIRMRDKPAARLAIQSALARTPAPTSMQRLVYADALVKAGYSDAAVSLLRQVDPRTLQPLQRTAYNGLSNGLAIQQSDKLVQAGKSADAYQTLAPRLQSDPDAPGLNLAVGRVYQAQGKTQEALRLDEQVLGQNPSDLDVRRSAVAAAIQAGDTRRASQLAKESVESSPDDPRSYLMAADVARADGNDGQALTALRRARTLRLQQLDSSKPADQ